MRRPLSPWLVVLACVLAPLPAAAQTYDRVGDSPLYDEFFDAGFPFAEVTVDLRGIAPVGNGDNLLPRGLLLALPGGHFVCFDTELLRVAAVWTGDFISPQSIAMLSYPLPLRKMGAGTKDLPRPRGELWAHTGLYEGWQEAEPAVGQTGVNDPSHKEAGRWQDHSLALATTGAGGGPGSTTPATTGRESAETGAGALRLQPKAIELTDPRPRWRDARELGRGPLAPEHGEWVGVEDRGSEVVLHYMAFGARVQEHFRVETVAGATTVIRSVRVEGLIRPVQIIVGAPGGAAAMPAVRAVPADAGAQTFCVAYSSAGVAVDPVGVAPHPFATAAKREETNATAAKREARWQETVATAFEPGAPQGAYAVDHLRLPYPNPWRRRIRPIDIEFLPDGDALVLTFDGDVYRLSGLGTRDEEVRWRRVAAGFNEPQALAVRGDEVFVFSRLGITRLEDRDGDGETDFYAMFCNRFTQSADTRDYPMSLVVRSDGSFVLTKGGQQTEAASPHSGRALWVSADGKSVEVWATGLRNGYLGIIPGRDLIVASDQQGNWVPSTPFHVVRRGSFLGFEPGGDPAARVQPPALWLPHRIAPSGIDPIWGGDARLGPLAESVLYLDYTRPSVTKILLPPAAELTQTAGVPLNVAFEVPLLKGAINPADGQAYLVGFQVWDSFAKRLEGLCRLRVLRPDDSQPVAAEVFRAGVWLRFARPLDAAAATDPANYRVSSWDYRRASSYGSSYYRADGVPGVDPRPVHAVLVSEDRRSVFLAVAGLVPAMQIEVQHRLAGEWAPVYFTAHELPGVGLTERGFGPVDLAALFAGPPAPRDGNGKVALVSEVRGQEVATTYGCVGCHSTDGSTAGKSGPTWRGLFGRNRELVDGRTVRADEEYLREAILDPGQARVRGYEGMEAGMPPYRGILSDEDVASVILFIRSLR